MAMVNVCRNLKTSAPLARQWCSASRPAFAAFSPCDQQFRGSGNASSRFCCSAAGSSSPCIPGVSSHFFSMETRQHALPDQGSKAGWSTEEQEGGSGDAGGWGNGGENGSGGHGGGDPSDGNPKPDDSGSPFGWYLLLLDKHPVTTKAITSALLTLFGDIVCQLIVEKSERVNFTRLGIFTLLGFILVGPTLHFWYLLLSKFVPGPGALKAGARLVLDQFFFSPIFIAVFISALMTLEGHSYDIVPKLKQDWIGVVVTNWKIWIPFQFLNFLIVPQQLQVLVANVIALAWNTYLSFATHRSILPPAQRSSITS